MKIYSLIFDYNLQKMKSTGRPWADTAYKNKDFIFSYSAASIATFVHHNPHLQYDILTDDVGMLEEKLSIYKIDKRNLNLVDTHELIEEWTSHWYCFWPLIQSFDYHIKKNNDGVLKLDNDLTCLKPIDDLLKTDKAIVWKKERLCSTGREYWGEKYAAKSALGTDNFFIYNTGTWGLPKQYVDKAFEIPKICDSLIKIDISHISKFPELPGVKSKVFNTSDQVSNCYFLHKNNIEIIESIDWFEHHCYDHNAKQNCIRKAYHIIK